MVLSVPFSVLPSTVGTFIVIIASTSVVLFLANFMFCLEIAIMGKLSIF